VESALANALLGVGYRSDSVRVSDFLRELDITSDKGDGSASVKTKIDVLMDKGDALRLAVGHGAAAAAIAISEISSARGESNRTSSSAEDDSGERESFATIVRQLKHPEEVRLFRSVYGPRFILIGAWAPTVERDKAVRDRLRVEHPGETDGWYSDQVTRLLTRDEKDGQRRLGQRVRDTFELADAYVSLLPGTDPSPKLKRVIELLFGAPFETPHPSEQAMFHASGARLRSSDAGRQVGAVVVDGSGELLVSGVNEVPKAGGGQYWSGDKLDHRDFREGFDVNERQKRELIVELLGKLHKSGDWFSDSKQNLDVASLATAALEGGPLSKSRVGDILEFARVAHAEMAAISTAARRGTAIGGMTMYTTTYPCHECARLIIASGIKKVVYVDPYPKSQVPEMYRHEIMEGPTSESERVIFEPFEGVAPRLFGSVFVMPDRSRDDSTGAYGTWNPAEAPPRLVADAEAAAPMQTMEDGAILPITQALRELGVLNGESASDMSN